MRITKVIAVILLTLSLQSVVFAQSLPLSYTAVDEFYRRQQLVGGVDTNLSFTVRPIYPNYINKPGLSFYPDSGLHNSQTRENSWSSKNGKLSVSILPLNLQTQFNTHHPYGWNDGAMIPNKGLQTVANIGVFAKYGILTVQFAPEILLASNSKFEPFNKNQYDVILSRYYDIYNNIDLPARFGTSAYGQVYWGQSSIRLNYKSFSAGVSTENLWWGPGVRNSLLMSNNAPGFKHFTLNTLKPVNTAIGSFEGQIVAGSLGNSQLSPLSRPDNYFGIDLYVPKPNNWRFLTGFVLTWQPKWVPGLFLGIDQTSQMYGKNIRGIKDWSPFFSSLKTVSGPDEPIDNIKDKRSAWFARWVWPQERAEVYFEWGQNNNSQDINQSLLSPQNSRAYIWGLRKVLTFNAAKNENLLIGLEFTELQSASIANVRSGNSWYTSKSIRHGYTNYGQVIGAGIGPGSNLQSLSLAWFKGLKKLGLQFERYVHNNDYYYYVFADNQNYSQHWVDFSVAASGEWNYKNIIFNARLQAINSLNYQWALKQNGNDHAFQNQLKVFNMQIQAGMLYRF